MPKVSEIHVICHDNLNVQELENGHFKSGDWVVAECHCHKAKLDKDVYFALHETKKQPSYRQGIIQNWERCPENPKRIIFEVKPTKEPMEWQGRAAGEKGYCWSDD
jgi:hypothetical protein